MMIYRLLYVVRSKHWIVQNKRKSEIIIYNNQKQTNHFNFVDEDVLMTFL